MTIRPMGPLLTFPAVMCLAKTVLNAFTIFVTEALACGSPARPLRVTWTSHGGHLLPSKSSLADQSRAKR